MVIADIDVENGPAAAYEIVSRGGSAHFQAVDITNEDHVQLLFDSVSRQFSRLDILVNNAGVGLNRTFLETSLSEWDRLMRVVLTGTFLCSQAAARSMVARGRGNIINIASISGQLLRLIHECARRTGAAKAGGDSIDESHGRRTGKCHWEFARQRRFQSRDRCSPTRASARDTEATAANRTSIASPCTGTANVTKSRRPPCSSASDELASFVNGHILNVDGGFPCGAGLMFDPDG